MRSKLSPLGFEQSLISAVIDDPTGIWRSSSREGTTLLNLPQAEKDQIISAYVDGFHTLFHVLAGLISGAFVIAVVLIKRHSLSVRRTSLLPHPLELCERLDPLADALVSHHAAQGRRSAQAEGPGVGAASEGQEEEGRRGRC